MKKVSLSVCMIVKNEDQFLDDCLKSIREVADQIVVVDTGSTDNTVAIARSHGAEVYPYDWSGDFAAARNESIKYARGDWILWLDADERLDEGSISELRSLLKAETKPVTYIIPIYNYLQDGKNYKISSAHRLFTNNKGICFEGRIHEQVAYSISRLGGVERPCNVILHHYGYGLDDAAQEKKNKRNRVLLETMVAEEPDNAYAHFTLAQHYSLTGENRKALKHFEIARRRNNFNPGMRVTLLNTMAEAYFREEQWDAAQDLLDQSIGLMQEQTGAYYLQYRLAVSAGDIHLAIQRLKVLIEKNKKIAKNGKNVSTEIVFSQDVLNLHLANLYFQMSEFEKALALYDILPEDQHNSLTVLDRHALCCINSGRYGQAVKILRKLCSLLPENHHYLDLLATVYIKNQQFIEAARLYEQLVQIYPQNQNIRKRLAGLYAKLGDFQKARDLITISV